MWFSPDGTTFELLPPGVRLGAVGYAISSVWADGLRVQGTPDAFETVLLGADPAADVPDLDAAKITSGAFGSSRIADGSIAEVDLDVMDSPASGEQLPWNGGSSRLEWVPAPAGGASVR